MPKANEILRGIKRLKAVGLNAEWKLLKNNKVFKISAKITDKNFEEYSDFLSKLLSDNDAESKSVKEEVKKYTGSTKSPQIIGPQIKLLSPTLAKIVKAEVEIPEAPPLPVTDKVPKAPPPPKVPPEADPEAGEFDARLKKLNVQIKKAAGTAAEKDIKLKVSEASMFVRKEDFKKANSLLDDVEKLLEANKAPEQKAFEARFKELVPQIKQAAKTAAGKDAKLKASEAGVFANKQDFKKANALLDEAESLLQATSAETEDPEGEDEEVEPLIDPKLLKKYMKAAKNKAHPFACGLAADGLTYTMNKPAKKGEMLAKSIKKATGATKLSFGKATLEGKILVLDLDPQKKPLPGMERKMKKWLKENKPLPANKVRLMQGGEEVPLTPEELLQELLYFKPLVATALKKLDAANKAKVQEAWALVNQQMEAGEHGAARKTFTDLEALLEAGSESLDFDARVEDLKADIKETEGTTAAEIAVGKEANLKVSEAGVFARKQDFDKANDLLDEAQDLLDNWDADQDDDEPLIDPKQLKKFMKLAKKDNQYPFACGLAADGLAYTMNKPAKEPKALARNVKKATGATKLTFGLAWLEGKILVLDLQKRQLPGMMRKMKKWLKENKPLPANKARLMLDGQEVPLSSDELAEELAEYEPRVLEALKSGGDKKISVVWGFIQDKADAGDNAAAWKALANLDILLAAALGSDIPEAPPPPSTGADSDLMARLKGLTARIKAFAAAADAAGKAAGADMAAKKAALAPKNRLLTLVRDCKGMIGKNDEQAEAMLAEIETILGTIPKAPPLSDTPPQEAKDTSATTEQGDQAANLDDAIKIWESAQDKMKATLRAIEQTIKTSDHAEKDQALMQFMAVRMQLSGKSDKMRQMKNVLEMEKYLQEDDLVDDICNFREDIRTPLLAATKQLKAVLEPVAS